MSRSSSSSEEKNRSFDRSRDEQNSNLNKNHNTTARGSSTKWRDSDFAWLQNPLHGYSPDFQNIRDVDLENAIFEWFRKSISNTPITEAVFTKKAEDLAESLGRKEFRCNAFWVEKFRERYGIAFGKFEGEFNPGINTFDDKIRNICNGYSDDDIFYATEASIFYKLTPNQILNPVQLRPTIGDRLSMVIFVNISGTEKRPVTLIGKSKKPRLLGNVSVRYESDTKGQLTPVIFETVLFAWELDLSEKNRKILLLVDNRLSYLNRRWICHRHYIRLEFLPPCTRSSIYHSCTDHDGIVKCLKAHYRRQLIMKITDHLYRGQLFNITLVDAISMLSRSWDDISSTTVCSIFANFGSEKSLNFADVLNQLQELLLQITLPGPTISVDDFLTIDEQLLAYFDNQTYDFIARWVDRLGNDQIVPFEFDERDKRGGQDATEVMTIDEDTEKSGSGKGIRCNASGIVPTIFEARTALKVLQAYCSMNLSKSKMYAEYNLKQLENHLEMEYRNQASSRLK